MIRLEHYKKNLKILFKLCCVATCLIFSTSSFANTAMALPLEVTQSTVSGTITSAEDGMPIPGVNIVVKGTTTGTTTDFDGNYSINVPNSDAVLSISYLGFETQEVAIGSNSTVNVTMEPNQTALDEVVVIGYGTAKKETLTGAVEQITAEAFQDIATGSPALALQGRTPGLVVTRNSSRPGDENINFLIRGESSINGIAPLIVIDGIPTINSSSFNDMNPNDIESISVLKGGSASVYGSRAAGGVVLVTTKKGKGKIKVDISTITRIGTIGIRPPTPTMSEYGQLFLAAADEDIASGKPPRYFFWNNREVVQRIANGEEGIYNLPIIEDVFLGNAGNRFDEMFGNSYSQQHNISLSGGDEKSNFRISAGYDENVGGLQTVEDKADRYNFSANYTVNVSDRLSLNTNISYFHNEVNGPAGGLDREAITYDAPLFPSKNPLGQWYGNFGGNIAGNRNSVARVTDGGRELDRNEQLRISALATYKLTDHLNITGSYAISQQKSFNQTYVITVPQYNWFGDLSPDTINPNSSISEGTGPDNNDGNITYKNYKATLNYSNSFGDHNLSGLLAVEAERNEIKEFFASRLGFDDFGVYDLNLGSTDNVITANGGATQWGFFGYIGRLNYDYKSKYLLELQGRRDGSSRFADGKKWQNYFSVSGGWILSEENFLKDSNLISFLKLRGGYGELGSTSGIGDFGFLSTVGFGTTVFGQTNATQQGTAVASSLFSNTTTWERIENTEIGLDFKLFNSKVFGSVDLFKKRNIGMLIRLQQPAILGTAAPFTNEGILEAKGWEVQLGWRDRIGAFDIGVSANMSDSRNEVTEFYEEEGFIGVPQENLNDADDSEIIEGRPINSFFMWETAGYFDSQAEVDAYYASFEPGGILPAQTSNDALRPGDMIVVDSNGDGRLDNDDLTYHGDNANHYTFGLNFDVKYKNWDVSAFFQGQLEHQIYREGYFARPFQAEWQNQSNTWLGRTWTEDNRNAEFPRLTTQRGLSAWNYRSKDHILQNNKYLRLKALIIGYNIPEFSVKNTPMNVRVYFSGNDLWEVSAVKDGYDPEFNPNSNANAYPFMRTWALGLRVSL